MREIEKLKEIRDNLHKKKYLKNLIGDANDLEGLMKLVMDTTVGMEINSEAPLDFYEIHRILFRITSRIFSLSIRDDKLCMKYKEEETHKSFSESFAKLCAVKNKYWKQYRNEQ